MIVYFIFNIQIFNVSNIAAKCTLINSVKGLGYPNPNPNGIWRRFYSNIYGVEYNKDIGTTVCDNDLKRHKGW